MADPVTMAAVGVGSSVLGGITGAQGAETAAQGKQLGIQGSILQTVGSIFGMQTQAAQYGYSASVSDYQAGVATVNQQLALGQADYERTVSEVQAQTRGMQEHQDVSSATAIQASKGLDVGGGSASAVRSSIIALGQHDQDTIRANAARTAYTYEVQAYQDKAQSDLYTSNAANERAQQANTLSAVGLAEQAIPLQQQAYTLAGTAGDIGAMSSLVSAAGSVASKWYSGSKTGLFGTTST